MITTEAWVLCRGSERAESALDAGELRKELYSFPDVEGDELLVEPLFGCWEGNMSHAIARRPVDICRQRGEEKVVVGNSAVVRVLQVGPEVKGIKEGDVGALFSAAKIDGHGYMMEAFAYDTAGTVGALAKRTKIRARMLLPLPEGSRYSYQQWAAHSLRHFTAWSNWKLAYGAYRLQVSEAADPSPHVWGWGGGTTFAELDLARRHGCRAAMISGSDPHLESITRAGLLAVDRRSFPDIALNEQRYATDRDYRESYLASERRLLDIVREQTEGTGAAIFVEYLGAPVLRATLKALAREGVLATAGWMLGMKTQIVRALECINRHIHVHTHYARRDEALEAIQYSETTGWLPDVTEIYEWDDIPRLARAAAEGATRSYFPVYRVNPL